MNEEEEPLRDPLEFELAFEKYYIDRKPLYPELKQISFFAIAFVLLLSSLAWHESFGAIEFDVSQSHPYMSWLFFCGALVLFTAFWIEAGTLACSAIQIERSCAHQGLHPWTGMPLKKLPSEKKKKKKQKKDNESEKKDPPHSPPDKPAGAASNSVGEKERPEKKGKEKETAPTAQPASSGKSEEEEKGKAGAVVAGERDETPDHHPASSVPAPEEFTPNWLAKMYCKAEAAAVMCFVLLILTITYSLLSFNVFPVHIDSFHRPVYGVRYCEWIIAVPNLIYLQARVLFQAPARIAYPPMFLTAAYCATSFWGCLTFNWYWRWGAWWVSWVGWLVSSHQMVGFFCYDKHRGKDQVIDRIKAVLLYINVISYFIYGVPYTIEILNCGSVFLEQAMYTIFDAFVKSVNATVLFALQISEWEVKAAENELLMRLKVEKQNREAAQLESLALEATFKRISLWMEHRRRAMEEMRVRQLLERFGEMVGIAAWEWDTTMPAWKGCRQTRVMETLTGRPGALLSEEGVGGEFDEESERADSHIQVDRPSEEADGRLARHLRPPSAGNMGKGMHGLGFRSSGRGVGGLHGHGHGYHLGGGREHRLMTLREDDVGEAEALPEASSEVGVGGGVSQMGEKGDGFSAGEDKSRENLDETGLVRLVSPPAAAAAANVVCPPDRDGVRSAAWEADGLPGGMLGGRGRLGERKPVRPASDEGPTGKVPHAQVGVVRPTRTPETPATGGRTTSGDSRGSGSRAGAGRRAEERDRDGLSPQTQKARMNLTSRSVAPPAGLLGFPDDELSLNRDGSEGELSGRDQQLEMDRAMASAKNASRKHLLSMANQLEEAGFSSQERIKELRLQIEKTMADASSVLDLGEDMPLPQGLGFSLSVRGQVHSEGKNGGGAGPGTTAQGPGHGPGLGGVGEREAERENDTASAAMESAGGLPGESEPDLSGFWTEHAQEPYRSRLEAAVKHIAKFGGEFRTTVLYEQPDGTVRWFRCGGKKKRGSSNVMRGYLQDVTTERLQNISADQTRSRLQQLVDTAFQATMVVDVQEQIILEASPLLWMWRSHRIEGVPLVSLLQPADCLALRDVMVKKRMQRTVGLVREDPTHPTATANMLAVLDEDDPVTCFVGLWDLFESSYPFRPLDLTGVLGAEEGGRTHSSDLSSSPSLIPPNAPAPLSEVHLTNRNRGESPRVHQPGASSAPSIPILPQPHPYPHMHTQMPTGLTGPLRSMSPQSTSSNKPRPPEDEPAEHPAPHLMVPRDQTATSEEPPDVMPARMFPSGAGPGDPNMMRPGPAAEREVSEDPAAQAVFPSGRDPADPNIVPGPLPGPSIERGISADPAVHVIFPLGAGPADPNMMPGPSPGPVVGLPVSGDPAAQIIFPSGVGPGDLNRVPGFAAETQTEETKTRDQVGDPNLNMQLDPNKPGSTPTNRNASRVPDGESRAPVKGSVGLSVLRGVSAGEARDPDPGPQMSSGAPASPSTLYHAPLMDVDSVDPLLGDATKQKPQSGVSPQYGRASAEGGRSGGGILGPRFLQNSPPGFASVSTSRLEKERESRYSYSGPAAGTALGSSQFPSEGYGSPPHPLAATQAPQGLLNQPMHPPPSSSRQTPFPPSSSSLGVGTGLHPNLQSGTTFDSQNSSRRHPVSSFGGNVSNPEGICSLGVALEDHPDTLTFNVGALPIPPPPAPGSFPQPPVAAQGETAQGCQERNAGQGVPGQRDRERTGNAHEGYGVMQQKGRCEGPRAQELQPSNVERTVSPPALPPDVPVMLGGIAKAYAGDDTTRIGLRGTLSALGKFRSGGGTLESSAEELISQMVLEIESRVDPSAVGSCSPALTLTRQQRRTKAGSSGGLGMTSFHYAFEPPRVETHSEPVQGRSTLGSSSSCGLSPKGPSQKGRGQGGDLKDRGALSGGGEGGGGVAHSNPLTLVRQSRRRRQRKSMPFAGSLTCLLPPIQEHYSPALYQGGRPSRHAGWSLATSFRGPGPGRRHGARVSSSKRHFVRPSPSFFGKEKEGSDRSMEVRSDSGLLMTSQNASLLSSPSLRRHSSSGKKKQSQSEGQPIERSDRSGSSVCSGSASISASNWSQPEFVHYSSSSSASVGLSAVGIHSEPPGGGASVNDGEEPGAGVSPPGATPDAEAKMREREAWIRRQLGLLPSKPASRSFKKTERQQEKEKGEERRDKERLETQSVERNFDREEYPDSFLVSPGPPEISASSSAGFGPTRTASSVLRNVPRDCVGGGEEKTEDEEEKEKTGGGKEDNGPDAALKPAEA